MPVPTLLALLDVVAHSKRLLSISLEGLKETSKYSQFPDLLEHKQRYCASSGAVVVSLFKRAMTFSPVVMETAHQFRLFELAEKNRNW